MRNCIFTAHCMEPFCDKSCPIFAEISYLLERNRLIDSDSVYDVPSSDIKEISNMLNMCEEGVCTFIVPQGKTSNYYSDLITYCAICKYWKGSQLHLNVYNLRYSTYLDSVKKSWSKKSESEDLEYLEIWMKSTKVLIVSNFDYVNFGDFESQQLLSLIQERQSEGLLTIFVSPNLNSLVSTKSSAFFRSLKRIFKESVMEVNK